ncbi:MAG: DUF6089 family protein [Vicingaceae bacterium]
MRQIRFLSIILAFIASSLATAVGQRNEFGLFLGMSYYNGELNPGKHIVEVSKPALGVFYDAHINSRYYFRTIASYGQIAANDGLTDVGLNNFRNLQFEARVIDLSGQIHFNFLPYGIDVNSKPYTPYIFVGLALFNVNPSVSSMNTDSATARPTENYSRNLTSVAIPFGAGFKAIFGTFTVGLEWNFRKTFSDDFDGVDNQYKTGNVIDDPVVYPQPQGFQKGLFYTKDWYSFIGLTVSFRPLPKKNACPGMN